MLRLATMDDAAELLRWRNDEVTRHFRDDPRMVTRDEHMAWLARRQASPSNVYVYELDGVPVGNITLDMGDGSCELGWIIAPEHRGRGLAVTMAKAALELIAPATPWAKMREDNLASARVAERLGFPLAGKSDGMLYYGEATPLSTPCLRTPPPEETRTVPPHRSGSSARRRSTAERS